VLLITLDTTRRDHLGMYGYEIPTSPNLDALARDGVVYTEAYAVSSWTMPTHASMFTGKFPTSHGAVYDPEGPLNLGEGIGARFSGYRARPIAEDQVTLAQLLGQAGYETAGIIAGPWMLARFRLGRGFDHYDDSGVSELNGRPASDVTDKALAFLEDHGDDPFFLFLNYYDPHSPWHRDPPKDAEGNATGPPEPLQDVHPVWPPGLRGTKDYRTFATICYDAEIHYMDGQIGRLLDELKLRGLYENTWIFVLADHGELLGDEALQHDLPEASGLWGHGDSLTQAEIHIPFLVKEPGATPRRGLDPTPVQQVDLLPTILTGLGLPVPADVQGKPFGSRHPVVAELHKLPLMNERVEGPGAKDWRHLGDWRVLVEGKDKVGWSSNGTHFLVDLQADPLETTNLYQAHADLAQRLIGALEEYRASWPRPGEVGEVEQPTAEELRKLEGLGYIGD